MRWRALQGAYPHRGERCRADPSARDAPHVYNLTVNPDESTPYNYDQIHSWVLYKIYGPLSAQFRASLDRDQVPKGAPLDYDLTNTSRRDDPARR